MKPKPLKGRTWNPYTIPEVIDPGGVRCIKVYIPDSLQWLQIFAAVMDTMCHWKNYELLGDTSAGQCAALMRQIMHDYNTFESCGCDDGSANFGIALEEDISMNIRISPDDSCIIQMWCIDHWENWYDPRSCIVGGVTQPEPETPPSAGDCVSYGVTLAGNQKWLLPVPVSAGDKITVEGAKGGWNDGTLVWSCPNGGVYGLGICGAVIPAAGGDPVQSAGHMCLIGSANGVYYALYNTTISIVGGASDDEFYLQANDSNIADNAGSIQFTVSICKAEPAAPYVNLSPDSNGILSRTQVHEGDEFTLSVTAGTPNYDGGFIGSTCAHYELVSLSGFTVAGGWSYTDCTGTHTVLGGMPYMPSLVGVTQWGLNSGTAWSAVLRVVSIP